MGVDPESGEKVFARLGKFGPMVQIGEISEDEDKKPRFASLAPTQSINTITLHEALELFKFPKTLGQHEGGDVVLAQGRFGPYLKHNNQNIGIPKGEAIEHRMLTNAIERAQKRVERRNFDISTLCESSNRDIGNPNVVKVVLNNFGEALYFSRATIPHSEHTEGYLRHIGLYAYRVDILNKLTAFPTTHYEKLERLEQLRALAFGIKIYVAVSDFSIPPGIDTPEDLEAVISLLT